LGLIDLYRLDLPADRNHVSGEAYWAIPGLMHGVDHVVSQHSADAMTLWLDRAHGYYGQYLYRLPEHCRVRLLGHDGRPLSGAMVRVYQRAERPGLGDVITEQVKFSGVTDGSGEWTLPNVPVDPNIVPETFIGDALGPNPFGYVAVVGTNGLLLLEVEHEGQTDYAWLPITEANDAYWAGHTGTAVFERTLSIGGGVQYFPPAELTEQNAADWATWAQDGQLLVRDDGTMVREGQSSLEYVATGGGDNAATYPGEGVASWDLSAAEEIYVWVYADNDNVGFQNNSPWIRLLGDGGDYIELHSTQDALNQARDRWVELRIPLAGNAAWDRTVQGAPDISSIRGIALHADTWDAGFTVWWDGLRFEPPVCVADFNADGAIDTRDVIAFLNTWSGRAGRADANGDGVVDTRDVIAFLNQWTAGC
ncbi:MAG: GC-type dockerin domain-anchored protein, partial [Phycisphaerales bacterium JB041]